MDFNISDVLFWSPRSIRQYACLFTERLSPRFHSAYRGCHPHHWRQQRLLLKNRFCLNLLLSFRSDILKAVFSCTIIILSVRTFHYKCFWFFLCKVSASGILQGHKSLLPWKIFQEIGVQSLLIQFLVPPKGWNIFRASLAFPCLPLAAPSLHVKITKALGASL